MEQGTFDFTDEATPAPAKLCECGCGRDAPIARRTYAKRGVFKGQPLDFIKGHYKGGSRGKRGGPPRKLFVEAGQRIGRSVVIDPEVPIPEPGKNRPTRGARLRCDCGIEFERRLFVLLRMKDASCGCVNSRFVDRTGQRFGKLIAVRVLSHEPGVSGVSFQWLCRCDCGNELPVSGSALATGHTRSCGCIRKRPGSGYLPGEAARNKAFRSYRVNAERRGLAWDLTGTDFERLAAMDCHYCGAPPGMISRSGSADREVWIYNGIDRVDNSKGYVSGNVVPCCKVCNHAKVDMSYGEFLAWIARLAEYHFFRPEAMPSALLATRT